MTIRPTDISVTLIFLKIQYIFGEIYEIFLWVPIVICDMKVLCSNIIIIIIIILEQSAVHVSSTRERQSLIFELGSQARWNRDTQAIFSLLILYLSWISDPTDC